MAILFVIGISLLIPPMLKFIPVSRFRYFSQRPAGAGFAIHAEQKKWPCHLILVS